MNARFRSAVLRSRRPAPQLQVPAVARPRNHYSRVTPQCVRNVVSQLTEPVEWFIRKAGIRAPRSRNARVAP
jgi:hypothetical protein